VILYNKNPFFCKAGLRSSQAKRFAESECAGERRERAICKRGRG